MDSKVTAGTVAAWRTIFETAPNVGMKFTQKDYGELLAICDLAKIALSPPSDVAGLVEELREQHSMQNGDMDSIIAYAEYSNRVRHKAADALLSLSARIREMRNPELTKFEQERLRALLNVLEDEDEHQTEAAALLKLLLWWERAATYTGRRG